MLARTDLKKGTGTPLIFLHGFLGTAADWEPVVDHLPQCSCIGYDLPGHGRSTTEERGKGGFTEEENNIVLRDFSSTLSSPPQRRCVFGDPGVVDLPSYFHLIGYSMGGRLALQYAAKHPEQIASLTLISVHPGLATPEEKQNRLASDRQWAKLLFELSIDEFLDRWYDQPLFQTFRPDLTMRRNQNIPALAASLLHYSLAHQPRFEIDGVLVGEHDAKFRALYKNPILIPNSGHMIHLENPKAVAEIIGAKL